MAVARGDDGMLVPSAAMPGTNLVIFQRSLAEPHSIHLVRRTELPLDTIAGDFLQSQF